ncbi:MAG: SlyX protein [Hydrocarboniphaga sp.]|uniref:SlyX family protein n=1 Tax=Hydrocarboniphaga sp. TaxID=2033016 RepID=UPI00262B7D44|nr:SlyX family protein [Hydrocarboniphaga sp.]MDB5968552.1 SlyX protein [Hydrocarboniphaga sp.]
MPEQRLIDLEMRLSYQEAALETLSSEIARQSRLIEQLQLTMKRIAERMPDSPEGAARGSLSDELPPHY